MMMKIFRKGEGMRYTKDNTMTKPSVRGLPTSYVSARHALEQSKSEMVEQKKVIM
jgi:hypothetical protein